MNHEDLYLFYQIKQGDKQAFRELHRRYVTILFLKARRLLHDEDQARAAVNAVFRALWRNRESMDISGTMKAHLYDAIDCDCRGRLDRPLIIGGLFACIDFGGGAYSMSREELRGVMSSAIAGLYPPDWRDITMLYILDSKSYYEIACILNMKARQVRSMLSRALVQLRLIIKAGF